MQPNHKCFRDALAIAIWYQYSVLFALDKAETKMGCPGAPMMIGGSYHVIFEQRLTFIVPITPVEIFPFHQSRGLSLYRNGLPPDDMGCLGLS